MSEEIVDNFIEEIVKQKINIEFEYSHYENNKDTRDKLVSDLRNLVEKYNSFKDQFPEEHSKFVEKNPKYDLPQYKFFDVLEIFAKDTEQGFKDILSKITPDTTQTVINVVEHAQSNKCYQWLKRNQTQSLQDKAVTQQEKNMFLELGALTLPKIKREEYGDLIGMSMAGILSKNYDNIQNRATDSGKVSLIRGLLAKNRKYINYDYNSLKITDQTDIHGKNNEIYRPRGLMAKRLIDSSYIDDKNNLFVTICTNDEDITKQEAQLFKTIKTLHNAYEKKELLVNGVNVKPVVTFFNQAFFCTQDEKDAVKLVSAGNKGGSKEIEGFNAISKRADFEKLLESPMSKLEMDKINGLATLSILGNELDYPNVPHTFEISDLIFANPVTAGSSTLWMYKEFLAMQVHEDPKRTEKLFNFLLDYSQEVTQSLLKIKPQQEDSIILNQLTKSHDKMISGIFTNFTSLNLGREMNEKEKEKIDKLKEGIERFNEKNPKFSLSDDISEKLSSVIEGGFNRRGKKQSNKQTNYKNIVDNNLLLLNQKKEKINMQYQANKEEKTHKMDILIKDLSVNKKEFEQLKEKLNDIGMYLYDRGGKGKKTHISNHLSEAIGTSLIMIKTDLNFSTVSSYLGLPDSEGKKIYPENYLSKEILKQFTPNSGTYTRVMGSNSPANKSFKDKLSNIKDPEEADRFLDIKARVDEFFNQFESVSGIDNLIHSGGVNQTLKKLVDGIEKDYKISSVKKPKKN